MYDVNFTDVINNVHFTFTFFNLKLQLKIEFEDPRCKIAIEICYL